MKVAFVIRYLPVACVGRFLAAANADTGEQHRSEKQVTEQSWHLQFLSAYGPVHRAGEPTQAIVEQPKTSNDANLKRRERRGKTENVARSGASIWCAHPCASLRDKVDRLPAREGNPTASGQLRASISNRSECIDANVIAQRRKEPSSIRTCRIDRPSGRGLTCGKCGDSRCRVVGCQ